MSWTLLRGTLHQRRVGLLWYSLGLVLYSVYITWFFPMIRELDVESLMKAVPKELLAFFSGGREISYTTLGGFLGTEYLGFIWIVIVGAASLGYAVRAFASEVDAGTMEFLLAQPLSRTRFALTRIAGLALTVATLIAATTLPIFLVARWRDITVVGGHVWTLSWVGFLVVMAISSLGLLVSAASSTGGRPAAITGGVLGAMWMLHFLRTVAKWADRFESVNVFRYWDPARYLDGGGVPAETIWVLTGATLLFLAASVVLFSRRDVT